MAIKVIIDTELGNNIDEAFSVALAAVSPELNVLGVTTTQLRAAERARVARSLLAAFGRTDVPIHAGHEASYSTKPIGGALEMVRGLNPTVNGSARENATAAGWLAQQLAQHRGITYVANAPLTNLSSVLRHHPKLASSIHSIVMMGGWVTKALPESNIMSDPDAAQVVMSLGIPIVAFGYEVTLGCVMPPEWLQVLFSGAGKGPRLLSSLTRRWQQVMANDEVILHDPLTVAYLCRPEMVTFTPMQVSMRRACGRLAGILYRDDCAGVPMLVATGVDRLAYLHLVTERLTGTRIGLPAVTGATIRGLDFRLLSAATWDVPPGWTMVGDDFVRDTLIHVVSGCVIADEGGGIELRVDGGNVLNLPQAWNGRLLCPTGAHLDIVDYLIRPDDISGALPVLLPRVTPAPQRGPLERALMTLMERYKGVDAWSELTGRAALYEVIALICRDAMALGVDIASLQKRSGPVRKTRQLLDATDGGWSSLDELSRKVGMSRFQYLRAFKDAEHTTPYRYSLRRRMEHACSLLEAGEATATEIAAITGYSSPPAFTRAFKKEVGISPSDYRRAIKSMVNA